MLSQDVCVCVCYHVMCVCVCDHMMCVCVCDHMMCVCVCDDIIPYVITRIICDVECE